MTPAELGQKHWEYQYAEDDSSYHWFFSNPSSPQNNADLPFGYGVIPIIKGCYLVIHLESNKAVKIDDVEFLKLQSIRRKPPQ